MKQYGSAIYPVGLTLLLLSVKLTVWSGLYWWVVLTPVAVLTGFVGVAVVLGFLFVAMLGWCAEELVGHSADSSAKLRGRKE